MDVAYVIKSNVTGLYLKSDFGEVDYMKGQTKKISRAIIFESKEDLKQFWDSKLLTETIFKVEEI